jgi:putative endonuclease
MTKRQRRDEHGDRDAQGESVGVTARSGVSKTERGAMYEQLALDYLSEQGLRAIARNVHAAGAEIDLIMRDAAGSVIFVEVRARSSARFGGAAASVGIVKRRHLRRAAAAWLLRWRGPLPACRFDVLAIEQGRIVWLRDAFGEKD